MPEVVTYLEMRSSDELNAAPSIPEVSLERAHAGSPLIRELTERVGRPCGWRTVSWSDQKWAEFLANPDVQAWLITHEDGPAGRQHLGITMYQLHPAAEVRTPAEVKTGAEVQLTHFGLVPELIGRGLGGYALTVAIRTAWTLIPGADRVWLHTSTLDHPNALPNYQKRGFRPYQSYIREP
jgi:GNAT superfamily N-acetyltransferase